MPFSVSLLDENQAVFAMQNVIESYIVNGVNTTLLMVSSFLSLLGSWRCRIGAQNGIKRRVRIKDTYRP